MFRNWLCFWVVVSFSTLQQTLGNEGVQSVSSWKNLTPTDRTETNNFVTQKRGFTDQSNTNHPLRLTNGTKNVGSTPDYQRALKLTIAHNATLKVLDTGEILCQKNLARKTV